MQRQITCKCGKWFTVTSRLAGKRAKCPGCGQSIVFPAIDVPSNVDSPQHQQLADDGFWDAVAIPPAAASDPVRGQQVTRRNLELRALQEELGHYKLAGAAMGIYAIDNRILDHAVSDVVSGAVGRRVVFTSEATVDGFQATKAILQRKLALEAVADPQQSLPLWIAKFGSFLLVCLGLLSVRCRQP